MMVKLMLLTWKMGWWWYLLLWLAKKDLIDEAVGVLAFGTASAARSDASPIAFGVAVAFERVDLLTHEGHVDDEKENPAFVIIRKMLLPVGGMLGWGQYHHL
jgi:hypothetical protein